MVDMPANTAIARPHVETWHEDEASYRLLFLHHLTPMWFMDEVTLAFLEVNEAAIRHYGYSRDEFSRMTLLDISLPEEVLLVLDHGQRSYPAPGHERVGPPDMWRHRTQDGTVIDVDIVRCAVVFRGRQASLVIAHDVTERTRCEVALRKSYEELDRRVQERTFALARANASLRAEVAERMRPRWHCGTERSACTWPSRLARWGPGSGTSRLAHCSGPRRWSLCMALLPAASRARTRPFSTSSMRTTDLGSGKR
jgi:PAS domain S-box-containing protein